MRWIVGQVKWWLGLVLVIGLNTGIAVAEDSDKKSEEEPPQEEVQADPADKLLQEYVNRLKEAERERRQTKAEREAERRAKVEVLMIEGEALYEAGDIDEAIKRWEEVLTHDPDNQEAFARIKEARRKQEYDKSKKVDRATQIEVEARVEEARDLYQRLEFELALEQLDEALELDPWHDEARQLYREVKLEEQARERMAQRRIVLGGKEDHTVDREDQLTYVDRANLLLPGYDAIGINRKPLPVEDPTKVAEELMSEKERELRERLKQPVRLEFEEEDIRDIFRALAKMTGVTIIVDPDIFLETTAPTKAGPVEMGEEEAPVLPELGDEFEMEGFPEEDFGGGFEASAGGKVDPIVSIVADNVTLESALKLLLGPKKLEYKLVEDVIFISTLQGVEEMAARYEGMVEEVYHLEFGVPVKQRVMDRAFGSVRSGTGGGGGEGAGELGWGTESSEGFGGAGGVAEAATSMVVTILQQLVPQPEGAEMILYSETSTLIVKNTPSNQKKIKALLAKLDVLPKQVLIEARFLSVSDETIRRVGVQWTSGRDYNQNGFITYDEQVIQDNSDSHQYRAYSDSGTFAVSPSGMLSYPDPSLNVPEGFFERVASAGSFAKGLNFSWTHLNEPQFNVMINLLEANGGFETLSAPKVTTMSNEPAVIRLVTTITYASDVDVNTTTSGAGGVSGDLVTRDIEYQFVERDVGIILNVTPQVSETRRTVRMFLQPVVSDIVGSDDFTISGGEAGGSVVLSIPRFRSRDVTTNAVVRDGETLVLGGLMLNSLGRVTRKVPILGDLPLVSWLFKSEQKEESKQNLLIFVTVNILDFQGARLYDRLDTEAEEIAEAERQAQAEEVEEDASNAPELDWLKEAAGIPIQAGDAAQ